MNDIESNRRSHTRMDQDNEKNVVSPKRGGNDAVRNGDDIDESARNRIEEQREKDEAQRLREEGDQGINVEDTEVLKRDQHNP